MLGDMAQEHWFLSLMCNIAMPILILNRLTERLGPTNSLVLALLFPLGYGAYYLVKNRKVSAVSVLGLLNVLVTGGFALTGLTGIWFAVKEAAFPALIGVFVFFSSWSKKPFMSSLLMNPQVMQLEKLDQTLKNNGREADFKHLLKLGTQLLSVSFFISALLNFVLASRIFSELDPALSEAARSTALNSQIAEMTGWSTVVIVLPSMVLMTLLLLFLLKRLEKITGQSWQEFIKG